MSTNKPSIGSVDIEIAKEFYKNVVKFYFLNSNVEIIISECRFLRHSSLTPIFYK